MISPDVLVIEQAMQAVLDSHLDAHARALVQSWTRAWEDVRDELDAAVLGQVAAGNTLDAVPINPERLTAALNALTQEAVDIIVESVPDIVSLGVDGETFMIASQLPTGTGFHRADPAQIRAIIERSTQQITSTAWPIGPDADAAVRRRLVRGVVVGDNPRLVADQIMLDVEGAFTGGLTRALNISRTEILDAMRAAQYAADKAAAGVLAGWTWVCHMDSRTCRACLAMHGTEWPVTEPGPIDHHSGRCGRVPRTKSWAELGFTGIEEPENVIPDAGEWFAGLPDDEQRRILGKRGFEAWQAGQYPMTEWATRQPNSNWRDSIVPSKPPKETT